MSISSDMMILNSFYAVLAIQITDADCWSSILVETSLIEVRTSSLILNNTRSVLDKPY